MSEFEEVIPNVGDDPIRVCVDGDVVSINTNRYDGREYEGNAAMKLELARRVHDALGRAIELARRVHDALGRAIHFAETKGFGPGFASDGNLDLFAKQYNGPMGIFEGFFAQGFIPPPPKPESPLVLKRSEWLEPAFEPSHDCIDRDLKVMYRAGRRYPLPDLNKEFNLFCISPNGTPLPEGVSEAETI